MMILTSILTLFTGVLAGVFGFYELYVKNYAKALKTENEQVLNEMRKNTAEQIAYFREGFERGYEATKREPAFLNASQYQTGVETLDDEYLYEQERPANPEGKEEIVYEERYQGVFDLYGED